MCGRYVIISSPEAIRRLFGYLDQPNFPPRYNVAPTQPVPIVRLAEGKRRFALVRWGLIPAWVEGPASFSLADQRARRIGARQAGLPQRDAAPALPLSGRWLLRLEGSGRPASGRISCARRTAGRSPSPGCGKAGWGRTARRWRPRPSSPRRRTMRSQRSTTACR